MSETGNGKAVALKSGGRAVGIVPTNLDEAGRIAKLAVMGGLAKGGNENEAIAQATLCIMLGLELGISPMNALTGIAIIHSKPLIYGALIPALVRRAGHKLEEWFEGEGEKLVAKARLTREDGEVIEYDYSVEDAKVAQLWSKAGTWKLHPKRMLRMRCRGFLVRDGAPEVLLGMTTVEEMTDVAEEHRGELTEATMPPPPPPADTLADDAAFLAETTDPNQLDLEETIAAKAREDAEFIGEAVAKFQTAALNATDAEEVETLFVKFEEETDGRLGEDARQMAETVREANIERLAG